MFVVFWWVGLFTSLDSASCDATYRHWMMTVVSNMKRESFQHAMSRVKSVATLDMNTKVCGIGFRGAETARLKPNMLVASLNARGNVSSPTIWILHVRIISSISGHPISFGHGVRPILPIVL